MNRITFPTVLLSIFFAIIFCVSCKKQQQDEDNRCNTKIADYLYAIEYDDYNFNACKEYFDSQFVPSGACSEVRRGNFIGRNLDWYINRNASAIIKINRTSEHYASIGMVGCFPQFSDDIAQTGEYHDVYQYLPFKTEDGINECGLYVGVNVMPTGETSFDTTSWVPHSYGIGAAHTNLASDMHYVVNYLPRVLLDRASSVAEAIEIIASIDWTEPVNYPHPGETQSFHWLICDANRSVILEFIDNQPHYTEASSINEPNFGTIMTNFTNCLWKEGIMQINGLGYERFEMLYDNYNNYAAYPDNLEGMQNLMKQVWYTKAYTTPLSSPNFWYTEFSSDDIPARLLYHNSEIAQYPEIQAVMQLLNEGFMEGYKFYTDECVYWFSTHTSVYDIANRKMRVLVHEGRDGMRSFYEASLESHFAKPLE